MFRQCNSSGRQCRPRRYGLTLLEMLIAMSIMVAVVGTLGILSRGVEQAFQYSEGYGAAVQHARVCLERISRTVREATANDKFPGLIVLAETEGTWSFPDTLVVWNPEGDPANADGLPRFDELVVFCPNWDAPNQLVEVTFPNDPREVPAADDQSAWKAELSALKTKPATQAVALTSLMRVCTVPESGDDPLRGALRFEARLSPSQDDWSDYEGGTLDWDDLNWVQGIYGSQTGLRQVWLRTELQLVPGDAEDLPVVPFFGSSALYYELHR